VAGRAETIEAGGMINAPNGRNDRAASGAEVRTMQMNVDLETQTVDPLVFYLTGKQPDSSNDALAGQRPALLAAYADLTRLRYDFPLVLLEGKTDGVPVRSLSSVIDGLLQKIAPPGMESEQVRKMILRIEREIRTLAAAGESGRLSELWDKAAAHLEQTDAAFGKSVRLARTVLAIDGPVLDCHVSMTTAFVSHLWSAAQEAKAQRFRATAAQLAVKLADILRADYLRSAAGRSAESLGAAFGPAHQSLFDFSAMAKLLPIASPPERLSAERRRRIESVLATLNGQRFFAPLAAQPRPDRSTEPYSFRFDNCGDAISAYRARLPEMAALVKAMSIAEAEIDGAYVEGKHDVIFSGFDADALSARDTALFPDYLIILGEDGRPIDHAALMGALSCQAPLKILLHVDDPFEEAPIGGGYALALRSARLAGLATGLGEVFVLQAVAANLYQLRDRIARGLNFVGPTLFSVFSGAPAHGGSLPPYLTAAAAMQSRAFPAFSYDPSAGSDMASRFSLENNAQLEADWTVHPLEYADPEMQRISQQVAFTFVDFLICDPRYHSHFVAVPSDLKAERMVPAVQWIARSPTDFSDSVPYVLTASSDNALSRVIVDERAIGMARRCLENWHRLQESGGIHNSHAERLLKRERQIWEEQKRRELTNMTVAGETAIAVAAPAPAAAAMTAAIVESENKEPERWSDAAYIETERCSSCNECTQINDRMFAYNENKQAYIADAKAGTYAQLVEAAESCQLAIIHPGKPLNNAEPGLAELMKRAEAFL
jgi:4Fe-4S single cluster domain of Ferredoxin I